MIYARPGDTVSLTITDAPTGLVGQLEFRLETQDDLIALGDTTSGIVEFASGQYRWTGLVPNLPNAALVPIWTFPNGTVVAEDDPDKYLAIDLPPVVDGAYAAVADVEALNVARTYKATGSEITIADVELHLRRTAGVLNSILRGKGYQLPIPASASSAQGLLAEFNAIGAWAKIEGAATQSPHADRASNLWKECERMLRSNEVELEAPRTAGPQGRSRLITSSASPAFARDMRF